MIKLEKGKTWKDILGDKQLEKEAMQWLNSEEILYGKSGKEEERIQEVAKSLLALNKLREKNNPMELYSLKEPALMKLSQLMNIKSVEYHYPITALRALDLGGIELYSWNLIPTTKARDTEIWDKVIFIYIFPVARLFAESIRRMTPAIQANTIKPGDIGWATIKTSLDIWANDDTAKKLEDAGAIRPLGGTRNVFSAYDEDTEAVLDSIEQTAGVELGELVKFNVLIRTLLDMGVARCAARAEQEMPEAVENLKKLDTEISVFFRNR